MRREDGSVTEVDEDSVQRVSPLRGLAGAGMEALPAVLGMMGPGQPIAGSRMLVGSSTVCAAMVEPGGALALSLQTNPPSLDYAEDLATLLSLNECSAMHTLQQRYRARLPCTHAGPSLVAIRPSFAATSSAGKVSAGAVEWLGPPLGSGHQPLQGQWRRALGAVGPADGTVRLSQRGRCAGDTRGQGCSGLGMLWEHLGPGMLGAGDAFRWALLPALNFSWFQEKIAVLLWLQALSGAGVLGLGREQDWAGAWQSSCSQPGQSGSCWGFSASVPNPFPSAGLAFLLPLGISGGSDHREKPSP